MAGYTKKDPSQDRRRKYGKGVKVAYSYYVRRFRDLTEEEIAAIRERLPSNRPVPKRIPKDLTPAEYLGLPPDEIQPRAGYVPFSTRTVPVMKSVPHALQVPIEAGDHRICRLELDTRNPYARPRLLASAFIAVWALARMYLGDEVSAGDVRQLTLALLDAALRKLHGVEGVDAGDITAEADRLLYTGEYRTLPVASTFAYVAAQERTVIWLGEETTPIEAAVSCYNFAALASDSVLWTRFRGAITEEVDIEVSAVRRNALLSSFARATMPPPPKSDASLMRRTESYRSTGLCLSGASTTRFLRLVTAACANPEERVFTRVPELLAVLPWLEQNHLRPITVDFDFTGPRKMPALVALRWLSNVRSASAFAEALALSKPA